LSLSFSIIYRARGHVAVEWGPIDLVQVYIPPQRGLETYEEYLKSLKDLVQQRFPRPIIITGDFNAKSLGFPEG
jgi:exonuclease III